MRTQTLRLALFAVVVLTVGGMWVSVNRLANAQPGVPSTAPAKPAEPVIEKLSFPENRDVNRKFEAVQEYLQQKNIKWREMTMLAQELLDNKSDYFYQFQEGDKRRVSVKDEINRIIGKLPKEGLDFYQLTYGPIADGLLRDAKENGYDKGKLAQVSQRFFHTKAGADATLLLAAVNLETGYFPEAAYGYQRLLARPDADKVLDPKTLFKAAVAIRRAGDGKMTDAVAAVWALLEKNFPREGVQIGRKGYSLDMLKAELDKPVEMLFGTVGDQFVAMKGGNPTRAATAEAGAPFLGTIFNLPVLYRLEDEGQKEAADFVKAAVTRAYRDSKTNRQMPPLIPGAFPITAPNLIVFRGYDGVYAFYTRSFTDASGTPRREGNLAWHQLGKYGAAAIKAGSSDDGESSQSDAANLKTWWEYWGGPQPGIMFENPLAGSLSHDGKRVYFVDDFNVPPAMQPMYNEGWGQPMPAEYGLKGVGKKEYNRLVAVDLESGSLAWTLGRPAPGTRPDEVDKIGSSALLAEGAYFLGPPVTVNGKLYALMERDGHLLLACLDPAKVSEAPAPALKPGERPRPGTRLGPQPQPQLVWVQALGRANSPVRQDSLRRIQGAFLAAADGVMICPTNSGAVVAVDLNARSLLWAHTYATLDKGTEMGGGMRRGGYIGRPGGPAANQWRSSTPVIAGGRVVVSAYDSGTVQCLDLRSGKLLWQDTRKPDDLYVGGVAQDKVLIVGKSTVRAVKLVGDKDDKAQREKSTPAWKDELKVALPVGHGVVGKDGRFYLPVVGDPDKADDQTPAVWGIDATTGKAVSKTLYRRKDVVPVGPAPDPRLALGNLVFHDGMMFSQSATEVVAFPLNEVKRREVQIALDKNPNDPDGLFSRGELSLEKGDLLKAVEDFKAAQGNKPSDNTGHKIKQKLYVAYTELLRDKFDQGEPFLAEYKQLCEFPLDDTEPDFGRQREEQTRRRGLYYSLVAKGREAQGKLVDAFDHYRAYAELGEQGKLLPVPEDPNTAALPSVWASGRIDAMMRNAKDPAARKPLEDRVAKDWADVKSANDLDRLRNFVKVFGAYFASGRDAQFLLAERLKDTNNDDDRREAQALLLSLIGQAEDDKDGKTAAKATAALARLLTSRGLLDDALGLYARLADKYPDVDVAGGKTGGDLLGELITDKQYWPALEPERPVTLGKYVAKAESTQSGRQVPASLDLVPGGELFPFYKRHRVSLDGDQNTGLLTLKVIDRVTGQEKFKPLNTENWPFQNYGYGMTHPNASMANQRLAQVNGHILLLHAGWWVRCYDLSRGVELWKYCIANVGGAGPPQNSQFENWQMNIQGEANSDRDLKVNVYRYNNQTGQQTNEWTFVVGKSTVLQAGYASFLSKDGLFTKDPRTGTTLWQRGGLTQGAMIFGDATHLFLVEPTQTGFSSRVLRAVDGVQIPGVPEFGSLLLGSSRINVFGRQVLLFESGGKDKPRTLRLYDILDGKDVWAKQYPAESAVFETVDPDLTGVVSADGKIEVLAARTGKSLFAGAVDAKKVKEHVQDDKGKFDVVKPLLMADGERFYTFLNRDLAKNNNGNTAENNGPSPNRVRLVNGAAYAFSKATGERLWYTDTQLVNQRLYVDRFDELPCLVAFNPMHQEEGGAAGAAGPGGGPVFVGGGRAIRGGFGGGGMPGWSHKVVVIDKQLGNLREDKQLPAGNGWFQWVSYDAKKNEYEFGGYNNAKLRIMPPDTAKK